MPDILPPGNTPAWADTDPANSIASTWQQEMWPSIWPKLNHKYESAGERDSDLAGLGPMDAGILSFTRDTNTLWSWNGTSWSSVWVASPPAWTTHALSWQNGGPTELLIGNGVKTSRYMKDGRTVHWNFYLSRGSTTQVGTTYYQFILPVPAMNYLLPSGVGIVVGTSTEQLVMQLINSTTAVLVRPNGSRLSHDSFTWAAGHAFRASMTYESAS